MAGYLFHPKLNYKLEHNRQRTDIEGKTFTYNELGFRGPQFSFEKPPNTKRIVFTGASTVYGYCVSDEETASAQLERRFQLLGNGKQIEVLNAGVPGYTSLETLLNLKEAILSMEPDFLIVMDGRNGIFPQLFNNYRNGYSHYRKLDFDFRKSNSLHRQLFKFSHPSMILSTLGEERFGYSHQDDHLIAGSILRQDLPSSAQVLRNSKEQNRHIACQRNLETIVEIAETENISLILVTMPVRPEANATAKTV